MNNGDENNYAWQMMTLTSMHEAEVKCIKRVDAQELAKQMVATIVAEYEPSVEACTKSVYGSGRKHYKMYSSYDECTTSLENYAIRSH
jgi:hypothetical protein